MSLTIDVPHTGPDRIHLRLLNPDGYQIVRVMRTDTNGTRTVRVEAGILPSTAAVIDIDDYEFALSAPAVAYTVYRDGDVAVASTTVPGGGYRNTVALVDPLYPTTNLTIAAGTDAAVDSFVITASAERVARATVHQVIGRTDPVAVLRAAALPTGTIDLVTPDLATAESIQRLISGAAVYMLRQSDLPGLDMYFVVTRTTVSNLDPKPHWTLSIGYAEVSWPNGPYVPVTLWTYADVAAGFSDYNAVASSFVDYLALLEKRPNP